MSALDFIQDGNVALQQLQLQPILPHLPPVLPFLKHICQQWLVLFFTLRNLYSYLKILLDSNLGSTLNSFSKVNKCSFL